MKRFKKGQVVAIFQLSQVKNLQPIMELAGMARVVGMAKGYPAEFYRVQFLNGTYAGHVEVRFVDPDGQDDPDRYIAEANEMLHAIYRENLEREGLS